MSVVDEETRAGRLVAAERRALELFDEVVARGLVAPGRTERAVSDAVRDLAAEMFGISRYWHKRVVRAGENTLAPYAENPPDREIGADDIVFLDFGPILAESGSDTEADVGRTLVLGDDPHKHRLAADLDRVWAAGRAWFEAHPEATAEGLYGEVCRLAQEAGWTFGGVHCGHLVGEFPHEHIDEAHRHSYLTTGNDTPLHTTDLAGRRAHWILEVHLIDPERRIGGFTEQLLSL